MRNRKEVDVRAEVLIGESLRGAAESDFGFDYDDTEDRSMRRGRRRGKVTQNQKYKRKNKTHQSHR